ncbi:SNF1-related protein kinase regulatory subunit beta-2 isoform X2 [Jatropha curcas]|uniref:SNF1-related protein kinase regulatory subunit beta-2 isoform X2 n=1 Tax=Jatropha curcas TaxID=180498 RepID=UPI0009D74877|nr:SNF1-related protein kinase regulatory subunit beta-2 isoform X2 [Jatropha curcas]
MGNVNGRGEEEGLNSPSGSGGGGIDGGGGGGGRGGNNGSEGMVSSDETHLGYLPPPPELMGQSPPHSPRATHSPLMFTPQVPVVPLQRPDEIQSPSNSWMQTTVGYEEMCDEQGIPTMITWSYGGKDVAVEGSWDNWKTRIPLQRSGKDFTIMKVLPSGVYQYRFIVDRQWKYIPDLPWAQDDSGNAYNVLDLQMEWAALFSNGQISMILLIMFQRTLRVYPVLNHLSLQSRATTICNLGMMIMQRSRHLFLHTYR